MSWFLIWGEARGGSRGGAGGVTWARPFGSVVCRGHAQYPAFAPSSSEMAVGFCWSFCILSIICPNCTCTQVLFFFSPLEFLCILLLEETFVQVQALQQRRPGPRFLPVSPGPFPVCSKPLPTTLGAGVVISSLRNEVDETRPHKIVQDHTASGWQGWGMNLRFLISNSLLVMG